MGQAYDHELLQVLEVLLFASHEPLTQAGLSQAMGTNDVDLDDLVSRLRARFEEQSRPLDIRAVAGGYQIVTRNEYEPYLQRLFQRGSKLTLSKAGLETLAIVAYKQPVTRSEIDQIRGVSSDSSLRKLLEKGLVTVKGRDESVGRPLLYGTTQAFLECFGFSSLGDLPKLKEIGEIMGAGEEPTPTPHAVEQTYR